MELNPRYWAGKRVCVTGGTGFLGYQIVKELLSVGARVTVLALPLLHDHPLQGRQEATLVFGDVRDAAVVRRAVAGCAVVFHTAGIVAASGIGLQHMHTVHQTGTANVLAAAERGARVVHTSSIVAVGASRRPEPVTEDSPFQLSSLQVDYVQAKRATEQLALQAATRGVDVVVTNPAYLIGPDDHGGSAMGRFCQRFWRGRLPLAPAGGVNLVDVRDAAHGHLLAAEHGCSGRRYILGGEDRSFHAFMTELAEVASFRPRSLPRLPQWALTTLAGLAEGRAWLTHREPYPAFQHVRLNRYHWFCRSDRAVRELGYSARPLAVTLADTLRWQESAGKLRLRGLNRWWMRPTAGRASAA